MAACLPFFDGGLVALVGTYPGGVGHNFVGPNYGNYHNNGYDGLGTCTGDFSVVPASTAIYIGNVGVWNHATKQGLITPSGVGLGDGAIVSLVIDNTIIADLKVGAHAVKVKLQHGIFDTDPGHRPTPGDGTLTILCPGILTVTSPATLPDGTNDVEYQTQTFITTGGTAPYTYAIINGALPPGMSLSGGGVLSGTPIGQATVYIFGIQSTDAIACTSTVKQYALTVQGPLVPDPGNTCTGSTVVVSQDAGNADLGAQGTPPVDGGNVCS